MLGTLIKRNNLGFERHCFIILWHLYVVFKGNVGETRTNPAVPGRAVACDGLMLSQVLGGYVEAL